MDDCPLGWDLIPDGPITLIYVSKQFDLQEEDDGTITMFV